MDSETEAIRLLDVKSPLFRGLTGVYENVSTLVISGALLDEANSMQYLLVRPSVSCSPHHPSRSRVCCSRRSFLVSAARRF